MPSPGRSRRGAPPKKRALASPTTVPAAAVPVGSTQSDNTACSIDARPVLRLEEALVHVISLGIPQWDASEEEGGVLAGLKGTF